MFSVTAPFWGSGGAPALTGVISLPGSEDYFSSYAGESLHLSYVSPTTALLYYVTYPGGVQTVQLATVAGTIVTMGTPINAYAHPVIVDADTYIMVRLAGDNSLTLYLQDFTGTILDTVVVLAASGAGAAVDSVMLDGTTFLLLYQLLAGGYRAEVYDVDVGLGTITSRGAASTITGVTSYAGNLIATGSGTGAVLLPSGTAFTISGATVTQQVTTYPSPITPILSASNYAIADMGSALTGIFANSSGLVAVRSATSGSVTTYSADEVQTGSTVSTLEYFAKLNDSAIIRVTRRAGDGKIYAQAHGFAGTISSLDIEYEVSMDIGSYPTVARLTSTTALVMWMDGYAGKEITYQVISVG